MDVVSATWTGTVSMAGAGGEEGLRGRRGGRIAPEEAVRALALQPIWLVRSLDHLHLLDRARRRELHRSGRRGDLEGYACGAGRR